MIYLKHIDRAEKHQRREEDEIQFGAPTFLTPIRDVTVNEGERARFEAKISPVGDPSMQVEWFFKGTSVAASKEGQQEIVVIRVPVYEHNVTHYECFIILKQLKLHF